MLKTHSLHSPSLQTAGSFTAAQPRKIHGLTFTYTYAHVKNISAYRAYDEVVIVDLSICTLPGNIPPVERIR